MISSTNPKAILVLVDSMASDESSALEESVAQELRQLDPKSYRRFPMTSNVVPFLHASDVVVFPTLLKEAFGRVVIEGMATGRPVVASRTGAVPEILSGPMARFLVEPNAPDELAAKLGSVLRWRDDEPELGEKCAHWVEQMFPFGRHVDQLEDILQRHRRRSAPRQHVG
jgi:glycosyltransferase involved in cell wall biosynthesis